MLLVRVAIYATQLPKVAGVEYTVCDALLRRLCLGRATYAVEKGSRAFVAKVDDRCWEKEDDDVKEALK
jgi:hypothetical protein